MKRYLYSQLLLLITACSVLIVDAFLAPSRLHPSRLLQIRAQTEEALAEPNPDDVSSQWHFLPTGLRENDDDILSGCDAVLIQLDTKEGTLKPHRWLRSINGSTSNDIKYDTSSQDECKEFPKETLAAIEATHRWAANFVRPLQLCPWAGSSLDTPGAIRYWVLQVDTKMMQSNDVQEVTFSHMESIIREAGKQLEQITSDDINPIDASAAISFVILVPMDTNEEDILIESSTANTVVDFEPFHEFFLDLEDRLLDEFDEYWDAFDEENMQDVNEDELPDGCKFTIAAFHPDWRFNNNFDGENDSTSAVDYEKRTPYPTISIVMSSVIDALMDLDSEDDFDETSSSVVTNRIAASNEKTLCKLGVEKLKKMFVHEVMCPFRNIKSDD